MRNEPPLAECAFGWGQVFRLYPQYLDVNGTRCALSDLTYMRTVYQHVLGISSVRLELRFGRKKVMLRGIPATEDAKKAIDYLTSQYLRFARSSSSTSTGWSRVRESDEQEANVPASQPGFEERGPITLQDVSRQERAQAPTDKVETPRRQRLRQDQRARRQRRSQYERSLREHGFDVEKLAQRLKEESLPEITVPIRLLPGEHAHYSTEATLCGEPIGGATRYTYPARDHGTLILTNKRLVYMGRRSQIVLDYTRLLHISRLRSAIAFQAEHWYKREIFEVRRSLECVMHLECILQRFQQEQQITALTSGLLDDVEPFDETSSGVNSIPHSAQDWNMAELMDSMDR